MSTLKSIYLSLLLICSFELSIGQFTYAYGSYTGNGSGTSLSGIGFEPDAVIIKSEGAYEAIFATSDMPSGYAKRMGTNATALVTNLIVSFDSDGFSLGDDEKTNKDGEIHHWMAFKSEGDIYIGTYTGNNHAGKNIEAPNFLPEMTWICGDQAHASANMFICLTSNPDDCDHVYNGTKSVNIISEDSKGFNTDGVSNSSPDRGSTNYYYMCFNNSGSSNLKAGGYAGKSGWDNRNITGPGFQPDFVYITTYVDGAGKPVFRPASLTGDNSFYFTANSKFSNGIQSFLSTGFQIGNLNNVQDPWNNNDYGAINGGMNPTLTLPIELSKFDVNLENKTSVRIEWSTGSETDNDYFSVERSIDGIKFDVIETIEGAGNSFFELNYMTYDINPPSGLVYYRVKQTDYDGKNEVFSIKAVFIGEGQKVNWIHVNNKEGFNQILVQGDLEKKYQVKLFNMNGSLIYNKLFIVADGKTLNFNCDLPHNLKKGIYLVNIESDFYQSAGKIIIR